MAYFVTELVGVHMSVQYSGQSNVGLQNCTNIDDINFCLRCCYGCRSG